MRRVGLAAPAHALSNQIKNLSIGGARQPSWPHGPRALRIVQRIPPTARGPTPSCWGLRTTAAHGAVRPRSPVRASRSTRRSPFAMSGVPRRRSPRRASGIDRVGDLVRAPRARLDAHRRDAAVTVERRRAQIVFGTITGGEQGVLCDFAACGFGGYGKSKACPGGIAVKSKASPSACAADPSWSKCTALPVHDYVACLKKVNADPCNILTTLTTDLACDSFKVCALDLPPTCTPSTLSSSGVGGTQTLSTLSAADQSTLCAWGQTAPGLHEGYLRPLGEPTEAPERTPARGPPYWRSRVLRRQAGVVDAA